jgi:hypothetical protein
VVLLLRLSCEFLENGLSFVVDALLVGHHVFHADTSVLADFPVRECAFVKEFDEERPGDVQHTGGLHGCQFRVFGYEGHAATRCHRLQDLQAKPDGADWKLDRLVLPTIGNSEPQRVIGIGVLGQALPGRPSKVGAVA